MTPNNERQADIPEGALAVHNPNGTAPSFIVDDPRGVVIALPGVPHELKWLFDNEVVPYLREKVPTIRNADLSHPQGRRPRGEQRR